MLINWGVIWFLGGWVAIPLLLMEMVKFAKKRMPVKPEEVEKIRETVVNGEMYRADSELWHLLAEEDPAFLAELGIDEPEWSKREKEQALQQNAYVKVLNQKLDGPPRDPTPILRVGAVQSFQNVDREIERKLEEKLGIIIAEGMNGPSQGKRRAAEA